MKNSQFSRRLSLLCIFFFFLLSANAFLNLNVVKLGAERNGRTDSTKAFLQAWASACDAKQSVNIYVPTGRYLIKQIIIEGPCKNNATNFKIDGTLVAPSGRVVNSGNWIYFGKVTGISISGGTLDGQGTTYWACKKNPRNRCPLGAKNLAFNSANDIRIKGLTSINSQASHIAVNGCNSVLLQGLKIVAPADSPNTDGIQIQSSTDVTINGTTSIQTGDDCVSVGPGTKNLWIERTSCGPGHGISIGSLAKGKVEQGVQNVTVKNVVFTGSDNGLRIKSWARPSTGFVKGVLYQDIIMKNVRNPVIIDQHYCPPKHGCLKQESGIRIRDVTYQNIQGSSATRVAVNFDCSRTNPCRDITLHTVNLTHPDNSISSCLNAEGTSIGSVQPESCL